MKAAGEIQALSAADIAGVELRSLVVLPDKKATFVEFKRPDDFRVVCKVAGEDPTNLWQARCHASVPGHFEKLQGRSLTPDVRTALQQNVQRFLQGTMTPAIKPFLDSVESQSQPPDAGQMLAMMKARGRCTSKNQMESISSLEKIGALLDPEQCPNVSLTMNLGNVPVEIGWTIARERSFIAQSLGLADDATIVDAVLTVGGVSIFMIDQPEWWTVTSMAATSVPEFHPNYGTGCSMAPLGSRP